MLYEVLIYGENNLIKNKDDLIKILVIMLTKNTVLLDETYF